VRREWERGKVGLDIERWGWVRGGRQEGQERGGGGMGKLEGTGGGGEGKVGGGGGGGEVVGVRRERAGGWGRLAERG